MNDQTTVANISYLASSAAVVFGVHLSAQSRLTGIDPDTSGPAVRLCVRYPNPFNQRFELKSKSIVSIDIYSESGQVVKHLDNQEMAA